mmetsp:Transcript_45460/g.86910  ORF Transcript_45460/g.86910 Transcript_45460/m.86910 type:complete len:371 (-) Transcript_45460:421-1533(-)
MPNAQNLQHRVAELTHAVHKAALAGVTSCIKLLVQHLVNHEAEMQQRPLRVVASPYGPAIEHLRRGAPLQQLTVLSDALAGPHNRRVEQASTALDLFLGTQMVVQQPQLQQRRHLLPVLQQVPPRVAVHQLPASASLQKVQVEVVLVVLALNLPEEQGVHHAPSRRRVRVPPRRVRLLREVLGKGVHHGAAEHHRGVTAAAPLGVREVQSLDAFPCIHSVVVGLVVVKQYAQLGLHRFCVVSPKSQRGPNSRNPGGALRLDGCWRGRGERGFCRPDRRAAAQHRLLDTLLPAWPGAGKPLSLRDREQVRRVHGVHAWHLQRRRPTGSGGGLDVVLRHLQQALRGEQKQAPVRYRHRPQSAQLSAYGQGAR